MKREVVSTAIDFCQKMDDDDITIGGGEPTLHPQFFDILKECLQKFRYVWMATNGSQTNTMYRLHSILQNYDFENVCTCRTDEEMENCTCWENAIEIKENQLGVALSLDLYHDPIDPKIAEIWKRQSQQHKHTGYEIRDVSRSFYGPVTEGRAKRTGVGSYDGCVCEDPVIKPNGKIRLCGCNNAPVIGDIWNGIEPKWQEIMQDNEDYLNNRCYKALKKGGKK